MKSFESVDEGRVHRAGAMELIRYSRVWFPITCLRHTCLDPMTTIAAT